MGEIIISRTDRQLYRRCRRAWKWGSPLNRSLVPKEQNGNLWLGTGFHYALEDMEGRKHWPRPEDAFEAFAIATRKAFGEANLPAEWRELKDLAKGMLRYYHEEWLATRDPLVTVEIDGKPAVEVPVTVTIPVSRYRRNKLGVKRVTYRLVIDRIARDEFGNVWIIDYKTAAQLRETVLDLDTQITSYLYAVSQAFEQPVAGFMYQTHMKRVPEEPRRVKSGKLSADKSQNTTYYRYRRALIGEYGSVDRAPQTHIDCLANLQARESEHSDKYVIRRFVERTEGALKREAEYMRLETAEMLSPRTPIYPNPATLHCDYCDFKEPCIALEYDEDHESMLRQDYMTQTYEDRHRWLQHLPETVSSPKPEEEFA